MEAIKLRRKNNNKINDRAHSHSTTENQNAFCRLTFLFRLFLPKLVDINNIIDIINIYDIFSSVVGG